MNGERRGMVLGQLELLRALAEDNEREQQLGSLKAYAYPQSLGEWLGTAVQLAGSVSWQTHYALRPLDTHASRARDRRAGTRHDRALRPRGPTRPRAARPRVRGRPLAPALYRTRRALRPAQERNGLVFSLGALGEAIWIYGTCRDRDAALLPTVATKLLEAAGFAALALAVADEA